MIGPVANSWQATKIGGGPVPIETPDGWLLLYHGVLTSCNGFVYSVGAALLDLDEPWKVLARGGAAPARAARRCTSAWATSRTSSSRARRSVDAADRPPGDLLRGGRHGHRRSRSPTSTSSCASLKSIPEHVACGQEPTLTDPHPSEAAPAAEPRGRRVARHVHQARLYTVAIALVALLAVLIVLISENTRTVKLSWAVGSTQASLVWIILASVVSAGCSG